MIVRLVRDTIFSSLVCQAAAFRFQNSGCLDAIWGSRPLVGIRSPTI